MGRPTLTERRKAQTRREIAETALALFAREGYDGVSAEAIAEEAGVSLRTFYRYFTGKDALLSPIVTGWLSAAFLPVLPGQGRGLLAERHRRPRRAGRAPRGPPRARELGHRTAQRLPGDHPAARPGGRPRPHRPLPRRPRAPR